MPKLTLNDICQYRNENMLSTDLSDNVYISTETMQPNREGISSSDIVTPTTKKVKAFYPGDILVSNIRPYFKKIWRATFAGGCSNDVLVFSPKCNSEYLYWLLSTDSFFNYMMATSKGTKMPRGDKKAIMKYIVPDHSDKEQRQIASFLNPLQNKIALNNRINDYLTELLLALQKQTEETEEFTESRADELFNIHIGKTPPRKEPEWFSFNRASNVIWMSIKDMGNGNAYLIDSSEYLTPEAVEKHNVKKCSPGSILLSFKLTVGRVGIAASEMVTNEAIACFSSDDSRKLAYLYPLLKSYDYASLGSTSSIAVAVNSRMIKAMKIKMPSSTALDRYYAQAEPIYDLLLDNAKETAALVGLRDTLLPRLMSGEIDVSEVEVPTQLNNHLFAD